MQAEPRLPDGAGLPQPVGEDEAEATETFLSWTQAVLDWGRKYSGLATVAKDTLCD